MRSVEAVRLQCHETFTLKTGSDLKEAEGGFI